MLTKKLPAAIPKIAVLPCMKGREGAAVLTAQKLVQSPINVLLSKRWTEVVLPSVGYLFGLRQMYYFDF